MANNSNSLIMGSSVRQKQGFTGGSGTGAIYFQEEVCLYNLR